MADRSRAAAAYARVAHEAAVVGSDAAGLARIAQRELGTALARALSGDARGDMKARGLALVRARAALDTLTAGLDHGHPLAPAFADLYGTAAAAVTAAIGRFDRAVIERVAADMDEIAAATG